MTNSGANHSFDIHTSADLLVKLRQEYEDFKKEPLSSRYAINGAMTAWHLCEWIWAEHNATVQPLSQDSKLGGFQSYLISQCPELEIMQAITNGSKHFKVSSKSGGARVKATELHRGAFNRGFSRGFDISLLKIELDDGSTVIFDDVIERVVMFWGNFFKNSLSL